MKLLEQNNRIFFRFAGLLLLAGAVLFYWAVNLIIRREIDEKLLVNQQRTVQLLDQGKPLPQFAPIVEVRVFMERPYRPEGYRDTMIYDPVEKEDEPYRQLVVQVEVSGQFYEITNRTSLVESEDLLLAIGICTVGLALMLFIGLIWLNKRSARQLWRPFHQQLETLRRFSLARSESLPFDRSGIDEFDELRAALLQLTDKAQADYRNLKAFTENASHELQTPLAIIRSKIESLIESEPAEEQMYALGAIYDAANRLSRLNQSLLLLTKIENRQFGDTEPVSVAEVIREQLDLLAELTESRDLRIATELTGNLTVSANRSLVEILVKNLLENAFRYSRSGSRIIVKSDAGILTFSNPGTTPLEQPDQLFQRFQKKSDHNASLGLGLAIVREICGVYGWAVAYEFSGGMHAFRVQLGG
ncbi:MAG TPA: HAMP domain-containing sensor histidine kinase [Flavilitoribacter sp.]|nr:HAMP domain-containing sensor histidine kinase [Flavilitoribacter sp.]HMQ86481.1 HAMP domain-containing sensor histidine kinase [Flavilitoribacter sp.]